MYSAVIRGNLLFQTFEAFLRFWIKTTRFVHTLHQKQWGMYFDKIDTCENKISKTKGCFYLRNVKITEKVRW